MEENILTDKNLLKYLKESDIKNIAELFSYGKFKEIIDSYFKKNKNTKKESNNAELLDELNLLEDNSNQNFSKSNKELQNMNLRNNIDSNLDLNIVSSNSSNNLSLFQKNDFLSNSPFTLNDKDKPYIKNYENIEEFYNSIGDEKEFNYDLIDKYSNDKLTQQILLTLVIYCLMRIKNESDLKNIFEKYAITIDNSIFPLILLKSKFNLKTKQISQSLDIYSQAINKYNDFKSSDINKNNNIIYIETYKQEFIYFNNLFNYLFALNNIDSKIKKLYYEQKFCLYQLGFYSEGFKLLIELYNKYQNDVQIQFELGKDSIYLSKYDIFKELLDTLQKSINKETNENYRLIYMNYYYYLQGLSFFAQQRIDDARKYFTEILKNDSSNVAVINNNALLSVYENKGKESYDILNLLENPNQMNSYNGCIHENINILKEKYKVNNQKLK